MYFHPLSKFPGPKWRAFTRIPNHFHTWNGTQDIAVREMHQKYGHVVRTMPDELSFTHPDSWKDVSHFLTILLSKVSNPLNFCRSMAMVPREPADPLLRRITPSTARHLTKHTIFSRPAILTTVVCARSSHLLSRIVLSNSKNHFLSSTLTSSSRD